MTGLDLERDVEDELPPAPPSRRWVFWLVMAIVGLGLLYLLRGALFPFVAGAAAAYFLDPLADWLERRGLSRTLATVVITGLILLIFAASLLVLIPALKTQVVDFVTNLPDTAASLQKRIRPLLPKVQKYLPPDQVQKLKAGASGILGQGVMWGIEIGRELLTSTVAIFNILSLFVISPVVAFYLLRDWDHIVSSVDSWLPRAHVGLIRERVREVDETLAGFVRGQATLCLMQAAYYAIALSLLGIHPGLVVGLCTGLFSFIPYVGSIGGLVISMALAFAQFDETWRIAAVAGVFGVGQFVEGNILSPLLVGGRIGLHPVWVMFALLAGGSLFGFVGVLLAVPVAAVLGVVIRHLLAQYLKSGYYTGHHPTAANGKQAEATPKGPV